MAHTGKKAYRVAVAALGLGITSSEATWCWRFCVLLKDVPANVRELRAMGTTKGPKVAKGKRKWGEMDPRVVKPLDLRKRVRLEPKSYRDIPIGGYPGMQRDIQIMRAEDRGLIKPSLAQPLPPRVQRMRDKLAAQISEKDWDREDD